MSSISGIDLKLTSSDSVLVVKAVNGFDGPLGRATAHVMVTMNRDMELTAVNLVGPAEHAHLLAVGFGPGVGVKELARRTRHGLVAGVDPSEAMVRHATRRNRAAVAAGSVVLRRARAESIPWPDSSFDGVVAVNSVQLWHPLDDAIDEVVRVLRPVGSIVFVTHRWAIERACSADAWIAGVTELLQGHEIMSESEHRRFRSGEGIVIRGTAPA